MKLINPRPTPETDPHFPQFHFRPARNWMNDPNGLIHWKGLYHLFYQYNPHAAHWGEIHWGHAASPDLVHWDDMPLALTPTPPAEMGCWSGAAVVQHDLVALLFTGIHEGLQVQCLAQSKDSDLLRFSIHPLPVIPQPPEGVSPHQFRDPCPIGSTNGGWNMLLGAGKDERGAVLLYRSANLVQWEYQGVLLQAGKELSDLLPEGPAAMWECPAFFPVGDHHALVISTWDESGRYTVLIEGKADLHSATFTPLGVQLFDGSREAFYAPQVMTDAHNRRLMFGWLIEDRPPEEQEESGWSGVMSLPRELSAHADGSLRVTFPAELQTLRDGHMLCTNLTLQPGEPLNCTATDQAEIHLALRVPAGGTAGLRLRASADGEEFTLLTVDPAAQAIRLDLTHSSQNPAAHKRSQTAPLAMQPGAWVHLHVYLDHSVVEVIANERAMLTGRLYPTRPDSLAIELYAQHKPAEVQRLELWQMKSIRGE